MATYVRFQTNIFFEYVTKHQKLFAKEYMSRFEEYKDADQGEKAKFVNDKLSNLQTHSRPEKLDVNEVEMDFDATILYPSAMWDKTSVNHKTKIGFAFEPHMNDVFVEALNKLCFIQNGNKSAFLLKHFHNPPHLMFQSLPTQKKLKNIDVNRLGHGYFVKF